MELPHLYDIGSVLPQVDPPDFAQLEKVLRKEVPNRPTLFEFFLNDRLHQKLSGKKINPGITWLEHQLIRMSAFQRAGYDFLTVLVPGFSFPAGEVNHDATISQNEGAVIHDRQSFDGYSWISPDETHLPLLEELALHLPDGMKLIIHGPNGVLENAISLVGYENLCLLIKDDPLLASDIFTEIGKRLDGYYALTSSYHFVGAVISNDDWGFKTQTLFSLKDMRHYVFPWHQKIVQTIHAAGKPAILHSCGYFDSVIEDVIETMQFDARHSYEDTIKPVEEAYETNSKDLAILGGIDVDFVCRSSPQDVYNRSRAMLERSEKRGAYALGTGNSVPDYVPDDQYFSMILAALDMR